MPVPFPILLLTITLPKPSIYWHQVADAEGKHFLQCTTSGEYMGSLFFLYQGSGREPVAEKKALPTESEVVFAVHTISPSEQFRCSYEMWEGGKAVQSPLSSPVNITKDHYPKPSIAVSPSTKVVAGQDWTIRCWASFAGISFVLYQAREFRIEVTPEEDSCVAEFSLRNVTAADTGRYTCYYHSITEPIIWSNASNPVQLIVIDTTEVPSYEEVLVDSAGRYRVNCTFPSRAEGWFYLFQNGQLVAETRVWQDGRMASFNLSEGAFNITRGKLICQYEQNQLNHTEVWTQEDSCFQSPDFTMLNSLRLGIGFSLLILALLFVADACRNKMYQEY
uniref:T-cell-interacting, activating receptor on myeloid cells protein 1-like isoform X1 n=1 Tax=Pogona vitticeps TaxID=103695 RepID=UPI003BB8F97D